MSPGLLAFQSTTCHFPPETVVSELFTTMSNGCSGETNRRVKSILEARVSVGRAVTRLIPDLLCSSIACCTAAHSVLLVRSIVILGSDGDRDAANGSK